MLPAHAPPEFSDRSTLWNSVEQIEKSSDAQLAREIEVALPVELSRAEQLALVRAFVKDNFVDAGMCADFALHDKDDGNPHAHIMLTIRPGCIANALLDRDVPVLMTNFPSILSRLCGTFGEERTAFLDSLGDYDLLIIDDLGVERNTEYALEQMFSIIDSRYRCNKPLIVTTNLKLDELKHPPDLAHARIYDRILERCAPILFAGKNFREDNAASTKAAARRIVSPDNQKN